MSAPTYAQRARALVGRWLDRAEKESHAHGPCLLIGERLDLERRIADALRRAEQKASKERGR